MASGNVPAAVASGVICLALGVGAGIVGKVGYDELIKNRAKASGEQSDAGPPSGMAGGPGRAPPGMGGPPGGGGMAGMMGGGGGGGSSPSAKTQLARLVTKLDLLTEKPLRFELTADEKKKILEQIKGLTDKEELSDEEAKKRLDAIQEVLKDKKETLDLVVDRRPGAGGGAGGGRPGGGGGFGGGLGGGGGGRPQAPANPFKDEAGGNAIKALEGRLAKG